MTGTEAYRRNAPNLKISMSNTKGRQQAAPEATFQKTQRGALITTSLPSLQNLIKRSSDSYSEEFQVQWNRFNSLTRIVQLGLGGAKGDEEKLREVTGFVCQASSRPFGAEISRLTALGSRRSPISTRLSPPPSLPLSPPSYSPRPPLLRPRTLLPVSLAAK